jgi:hypothetical protein
VSANGNLATTNNNADINASGVSVQGTCTGGGCSNISGMTTGAPAATDPLAGTLTPPTNPGGCTAWTPASGALTGNACYTTISVSGTVSMGPGTYYVTGGITMGNNDVLNGSGVMIYFAGNAGMTTGNSATLNLSAQTSGTYSGILFYGDPAGTQTISFGNSPTLNVSGALYLPKGTITSGNNFNFNPSNNNCALIVVWRMTVTNGTGNMRNTCSGYSGGSPLQTVSIAE